LKEIVKAILKDIRKVLKDLFPRRTLISGIAFFVLVCPVLMLSAYYAPTNRSWSNTGYAIALSLSIAVGLATADWKKK